MINLYDKLTLTLKKKYLTCVFMAKRMLVYICSAKMYARTMSMHSDVIYANWLNWTFIILDLTDINQIGPTLRIWILV